MEIPFNLMRSGHCLHAGQNVMFTLLLGFLGLCALEYFQADKLRMTLSILGLFLVAFFAHADYGYVGCAALPSHVIGGMAFVPIALYNGKRGFIQGPVAKYLFYAFYPLHMLVIWFLRTH